MCDAITYMIRMPAKYGYLVVGVVYMGQMGAPAAQPLKPSLSLKRSYIMKN